MKTRIRISSAAWQQMEQAAAWWREYRDKAPSAFDDDLSEAFDLIRENPEVGRLIQARPRRVRRVFLKRIRYHLFYSEREDGVIEITAIWHASRGKLPRL